MTNYRHYFPGDEVEIILLAAGSNNEVVKIKEKRFPESILVLRDGNRVDSKPLSYEKSVSDPFMR